ncbi:MAG: TDP-N-acetylfucosamine:lipid II N-acetylfucosaminyltransferase, partial [Lachnospiraceae bacterium]|nr:TDP-N-acetylfucosamine:lipid II N-acetylfucosaminyltransferase [Lachnospiraceae bacterium]
MKSNWEILRNTELRKLLDKSVKIIISGLFDIRKLLFIAPTALLKKIYIQFWGGDFYFYRDCVALKTKVQKKLLESRIAKCAGVINLIEDDYVELCKIFPDHRRHFTACMPSDPKIKYDYVFYRKQLKNKDLPIRILVGNSATRENYQVEAFEVLKKYKDEKIEIICPLSYGDEKYRDEVIEKGKQILGDKFVALTEFMEKDKYIELLATCDVAIFN